MILNDKLEEVLGDDVTQEDAFEAADDVLNNAVAGIAEIINQPGLVNVDFQDVRTVMTEQGMAMMGSAVASGVDRARIAAEQAIACPLLEGVNLAGARGVLVNITASRTSLKLRETKEVMNTIRAFAAEDATIIYGGVYDDALGEDLRVTVVATGLGQPIGARQQKPQLVVSQKTGTDNQPVVDAGRGARLQRDVGDARGVPQARPRRAGRGAHQQRRRQVRHPGVPAQAGGLAACKTQTGGTPHLARGAAAFLLISWLESHHCHAPPANPEVDRQRHRRRPAHRARRCA